MKDESKLDKYKPEAFSPVLSDIWTLVNPGIKVNNMIGLVYF